MPSSQNQRTQRASRGLQLSYIGNPLDLAVSVNVVGNTSQVYYDNTGVYSPDRTIIGTDLTPVIQATDPSVNVKYTINIQSIVWYEISREIGTRVIGTTEQDYTISGNTLTVNKNVHPNNPVDIRAEIHFLDPRGTGMPYVLYTTTHLSTIKDADLLQARLNIISESTEKYDPIIDTTSLFTFNAQVILGNEDITGECYYYWYAKDAYTVNFTLINSTISFTDTTDYTDPTNYTGDDPDTSANKSRPVFPSYGLTSQVVEGVTKGQGTDTIVLDAAYVRNMQIMMKARPLFVACIYPTGSPVSHNWYERRDRTQSDQPGTGVVLTTKYCYFLSSDTSVDTSKVYYNDGTVVNPEGNPQEQQWFELVGTDVYELTTDTTVVSGKTYYTAAMVKYIDEVKRGLDWVYPNVEIQSVCRNGNRLPVDSMDMHFDPLIDTKGSKPRHLEQSDVEQHCILGWYKLVGSTETFLGYGSTVFSNSTDLKKINSSQNVTTGVPVNIYYDLFFKENFELWTYNGEPVTHESNLAFSPVVTYDENNS